MGKGDVGLVDSPLELLNYDDGYVGTDDSFTDSKGSFTNGETSVLFYSGSQFSPATTGSPGKIIPGEIRFHSHMNSYTYDSTFEAIPAQQYQSLFGPMVSLRRTLADLPLGEVGIRLSGSWVTGPEGETSVTRSRQDIFETETVTSYTYHYDSLMQLLPAKPGTRIGSGAGYGVVYNALATNDKEGAGLSRPAEDPSTSSATSSRQRNIATVDSMTIHSLDVDITEMAFDLDFRWKLTPGWTVGLQAGPTLNWVNYDYTTSTTWAVNGMPFDSKVSRTSDTHLKWGAKVEVQTQIDLNRAGTCFLELAAGYDWMETVSVDLSGSRARFDASSWSGHIGVGYRF
ncbi:MAG: hypothetical protein KDM64_15490 [Verrucomicrobiae bacterium]|nr:hypothetical protein [Verrucomicrobiae bacterium]